MEALVRTIREHIVARPSIVVLALGLSMISLNMYNNSGLSHVPTGGYTGLFSYYDGYRFLFDAQKMLLEGYHKYRQFPGFYKVASSNRWNVILASPELVKEFIMAKEEEISIAHSFEEDVASRYTVGVGIDQSLYHVDTVRTPLTRSLFVKFDEVYDEITQSFEDLISGRDDEWLTTPALDVVQNIVCRTCNRLFLGEPICRNLEWVDLNIRFTVDVFSRATMINMFPKFLQSVVGHLLSPLANAMRISRKYLQDEVAHRLEMEAECGNYHDNQPNDLISWLMEMAPPDEHTVEGILKRVLIVNASAIHTTSNSFFRALIHLATYPEYVAPMREEVASVIEKYGWTKQALSKMHKVDSFLKESGRFEGLGQSMIPRKVVKKPGYTFGNGLYLPYGTTVTVPTFAIQHDVEHYDEPWVFKGFRSVNGGDDNQKLKRQLVSTGMDHWTFGHGRHSCPGRFFAAMMLKTMLAHLLVTYEIKLEVEPKSFWIGPVFIGDSKAKVLFKRRKEDI